jgi:molybdopterin-guanine dinucleotide biosynthesis protein A
VLSRYANQPGGFSTPWFFFQAVDRSFIEKALAHVMCRTAADLERLSNLPVFFTVIGEQ